MERPEQKPVVQIRRQESILSRRSLTNLLKEVDDIDGNDAQNLILVSEYVNDIYKYLNQLEDQFPIRENYMANQKEVTPKMRGVLMDWLNEVHLQFTMLQETFFMTVGIIDRYMQVIKSICTRFGETHISTV